MLQDLINMLKDFYNIDDSTDKGQKELGKLIQVYGSNISLYHELCTDYKLMQRAS